MKATLRYISLMTVSMLILSACHKDQPETMSGASVSQPSSGTSNPNPTQLPASTGTLNSPLPPPIPVRHVRITFHFPSNLPSQYQWGWFACTGWDFFTDCKGPNARRQPFHPGDSDTLDINLNDIGPLPSSIHPGATDNIHSVITAGSADNVPASQSPPPNQDVGLDCKAEVAFTPQSTICNLDVTYASQIAGTGPPNPPNSCQVTAQGCTVLSVGHLQSGQ